MATTDHQLLTALMEMMPDRIYFKDLEGRFLLVNQAMLRFLKVSSIDDVRGKTDFDFFLREHAGPALEDEKQVIATKEPMVAKVEREDLPDGRVTWASTTKVPMLDKDGNVTGTCGISRDVTHEHNKGEQLRIYSEVLTEKQNQMEQEMALARQVQMALLPQQYPVFPKGLSPKESVLKFAHRYLPAAQLGGDFFTIISLSETQAGVLICDVMGHGVHAALVTALQRVLVEDLQLLAGDPGAFLGELNQRLSQFFQPLPSSMFVTACYAIIDVTTGKVRFANAGHPNPIHVHRATGEVRAFNPIEKPVPFALGVVPDSVYATHEAEIAPGDMLLLFTDGLSDLDGEKPVDVTSQSFLDLVKVSSILRGESFLDDLISQVQHYSGSRVFLDDVCLVSVEFEKQVTRRMLGAH